MTSAITVESLLPIIAKLMAELHPDAVLHRPITLDSGLDRDGTVLPAGEGIRDQAA